MSARTAEVLGLILLALILILATTKLTSSYIDGNRQTPQHEPRPEDSGRQRRHIKLPRPCILRRPRFRRPRLRRPRPSRAERAAIREQNWRNYLETQPDGHSAEIAAIPAAADEKNAASEPV